MASKDIIRKGVNILTTVAVVGVMVRSSVPVVDASDAAVSKEAPKSAPAPLTTCVRLFSGSGPLCTVRTPDYKGK